MLWVLGCAARQGVLFADMGSQGILFLPIFLLCVLSGIITMFTAEHVHIDIISTRIFTIFILISCVKPFPLFYTCQQRKS